MERRGDGGCRSNETLQRTAGWTGSWCGIADAWSIKILGSCLSGERIGKTVERTEAKKAEGEEGQGKRARGGNGRLVPPRLYVVHEVSLAYDPLAELLGAR